jgi:very-short-patch-repair endonuclease
MGYPPPRPPVFRCRGARRIRSGPRHGPQHRREDGAERNRPALLRPLLFPARFNAAVRETESLGLPIDAGFVRQGLGSSKVPRTRTELEALFLALCRRHRLPQPEVNVRIDRFEVDFLWRAHRLIVEVDGWESHRSRSAFEEDRLRDARLQLLGYGVLRFSWRQVKDEARTVAATIRTLLHR